MLRLPFLATASFVLLFAGAAAGQEPNIAVEPPAPQLPPGTQPIGPPSPASPASDGPKSHVKITSSATVFLQHMNADNTWSDVCTAPCEADLVRGDRYRLTGGAGVSRELSIDQPYIEIDIDPPNKGIQALGVTGIVVGGLTSLIGFAYLVIGLEHAEFDCTYPQRSYHTTKAICERDVRTAPDKQLGGGIALGIGLAVTLAGLYAVVKTSKTAVTEKKSPDGSPPPPQALVREPTWRTTTSSAEAATPLPAVTYPFAYEGRF